MLSNYDMMEAIANSELKIYPYSQDNLTGSGYNLSTTNFAFSINKGILLTVHQRTTNNGVERYVVIPKNDTVLFFSKEYIAVDNTIAGAFHSKVARVCQGLGNISTTLDPTWKGQLIISVNNPRSEDIMFEIDKKSGNIMTMVLYRLTTKAVGSNIHDNNRGRCDLLLEHFSVPSKNKEYREKHLELKEFVVRKFADSLNGYDDFLYNNKFDDRYSRNVSKLDNLKKRLSNDCIIISESRYDLGVNGRYQILRNDEEKQLMKNCAIYKIAIKEENSNEYSDVVSRSTEIIGIIKNRLYIIDYELEMINHIRRIEWQNEQIEYFSGEHSELVIERIRHEKNERTKNFFVRLIANVSFLAFLAIVFMGIFQIYPQYASKIIPVVTTICIPILTLLLGWWYKSWKE